MLAGIGGVERWLPIIASCRVEGSGAGARRYCETADGGPVDRDEGEFALPGSAASETTRFAAPPEGSDSVFQ